MGLVPAATIFMPSAMMAALRMVAVVVPSPAVSFVFEAACICKISISAEDYAFIGDNRTRGFT